MEIWQVVAIIAGVLMILTITASAYRNRQRSSRLHNHFGVEYDRLVSEIGDRRLAEAELERREALLRKLDIRPLGLLDRKEFISQWESCQAQFVDDPGGAVIQADQLISEIMAVRGYPTSDNDELSGTVSAAYPHLAASYRKACGIVGRYRHGEASTENLRRALLSYRELFDELLEGEYEEMSRAS